MRINADLGTTLLFHVPLCGPSGALPIGMNTMVCTPKILINIMINVCFSTLVAHLKVQASFRSDL